MNGHRSRWLVMAGIPLVLAVVIALGGAQLLAQVPQRGPAPTAGGVMLTGRTQQEMLRALHAPTGTDRGAVSGVDEWTPLGGPVGPGGSALGLAVNATTPGTVYAAVSSAGAGEVGPSTIYRSTDGAALWQPVYEAGQQVNCLAALGPRVYAGAFQHYAGEGPAIYVSQDGGDTWQAPFAFDNRGVFIDAAVDPSDPDRAILGGLHNDDEDGWEDGVVYGTADGGAHWGPLLEVSVPDQNAVVTAVLISPHDPDLMLAALRGNGPNDTRIYRSTDGGSTWDDVYTLSGVHVASFLAHPGDADMIYAGKGDSAHTWGGYAVYRSQDAGLTWDPILADAGGPLAFEPPSTVYTVSGGQAWASSADGDPGTWSHVGDLPDGAPRLGIDLGVSPAVLYAGLWSRAVATSNDGGVNWQEASNGITSLVSPWDIDVDPVNLDKIFVGSPRGRGGWRTDDKGATWTQVLEGEVYAFEVHPSNWAYVYAGGGGCNVPTIWRSSDGGLIFDAVYTPPWFQGDCSGGDEQIQAVDACAYHPDTAYAAGEAQPAGQDRQAVVVYTHDRGLTWSEAFVGPQGSGLNTVAVNPQNGSVAWAGGYDRSTGPWNGVIYRTQDAGISWQQVFFDDESNVRSIVVDPSDPAVLYASTDRYEVHKSTDGGDSWSLIRPCCPSGNKLAIDPNDPNRIYLGGWGYIAESPDGGASWSEWDAPINQGTPQSQPNALAVDAGQSVQTLYAGYSGLWAYSRAVPAQGDRYVATTGGDELNSCTNLDQPCRTVGHALEVSNPGETIRVAGGTYVENLTVGKPITIEGGYSGPPGWTRDPDLYETVLDGSGSPTIPGDWDGNSVHSPTVLHNGSEYEMWYTGIDMLDASRLGRAVGGATSWTKSPENPLLDGSEGSVRLEGGTYRLWYARYDTGCLHYAESPDGLAWTEWPDPLLCTLHDGSWESDGLSDPSVAVDGGGTYWMYYEGFNWGAPQPVQIGCATSPDGLAWTRCAQNPVLAPDPGAWDENWVLDPEVLQVGGAFQMWYQGMGSGGARAIGQATSLDGVVWTKHAGNPVLEGTPGAWDDGQVRGPGLWFDGVDYHLWYMAHGRIGYAVSGDGLAWTKYPDPVLETGWYGQWGDRVVHLEGGSSGSALDGLTITGGQTCGGAGIRVTGVQATLVDLNVHDNASQGGCGGGGIEVADPGGEATIADCEIHDNAAGTGGGLHVVAGASALVQDTLVEGNTAQDAAGARVDEGATLILVGGAVSGNSSEGGGGGLRADGGAVLSLNGTEVTGNVARFWGGGIQTESATVTLENVAVSENRSLEGEGAGVVLWSGTTAMLTNVEIENNVAETNGVGGINAGEWSTVTLENVLIRGNQAQWSTGLRLHRSTVTGNRVWIQGNASTDQSHAGFQLGDQSSLTLTNAVITGNDGGAGGLWDNSTLALTNVTVADNSSSDGLGGIRVEGGGSAEVRNSILYYNGDVDLVCAEDASCTVEYSDVEHPWPGTGNLSEDPLFGDGYHLTYPSPPRDAGTAAGAPDHDLDGEERPFEPGGPFDMGADEFWPTADLELVAVTPLEQTGVPGQEVVYEFTVSNKGDYPDTFGLLILGYTWPTELSAVSTGRLEPGEEFALRVTVTVAANGSDSFELKAESSWPPYPSAGLMGTTTAGEARIYLPLILRAHP